jgi:hypothetical protein
VCILFHQQESAPQTRRVTDPSLGCQAAMDIRVELAAMREELRAIAVALRSSGPLGQPPPPPPPPSSPLTSPPPDSLPPR